LISLPSTIIGGKMLTKIKPSISNTNEPFNNARFAELPVDPFDIIETSKYNYFERSTIILAASSFRSEP
jgi:hypothetical protein